MLRCRCGCCPWSVIFNLLRFSSWNRKLCNCIKYYMSNFSTDSPCIATPKGVQWLEQPKGSITNPIPINSWYKPAAMNRNWRDGKIENNAYHSPKTPPRNIHQNLMCKLITQIRLKPKEDAVQWLTICPSPDQKRWQVTCMQVTSYHVQFLNHWTRNYDGISWASDYSIKSQTDLQKETESRDTDTKYEEPFWLVLFFSRV